MTFPRSLSLIGRFESQVAANPSGVALTIEDGRIFTYQELNSLADDLARYICHAMDQLTKVEDGGGDDDDGTPLVSIMMNRDVGAIGSMLGILKAGAAYVPVDPAFPPDRQSYIFRHSRCHLAVLDEDCLEKARALGVDLPPTIVVSSTLSKAVPASEQLLSFPSNLLSKGNTNSAESVRTKRTAALGRVNGGLAYVLYTSGSTGNPKGVMVKQEGVVNIVDWFAHELAMASGKKVLCLTTFCFDISVLEIYMPLLHGATLVLAYSSTQKDSFRLADILQEYSVDVLQATPTTFEMLLATGWKGDAQLDLLIGGEAFRPTLLPLVAPSRSVRNVYGPTETTIWSSSYTLPPDIASTTHSGASPPPIPIGTPISETDFYLASEADVSQLAPPGQEGELCIGGVGVARGYLNALDLTQGRFIPCPYPRGRGLMYRTGDIVKRLPDSDCYVFVRRMDDQVKIGGFRIELAEIEQVYMQHDFVEQAVALVRHDSLVVYLKAAPGHSLGPKEQQAVEAAARRKLTYYMVPKNTVIVDHFPQTANGKLDRKALPDPLLHNQKDEAAQAAQLVVTEGEERRANQRRSPKKSGTMVCRICDIVEQSKGHRPQPKSSFASMGVDSIGAILFIKTLSEKLGGLRINPGTIFAPGTTIESFSDVIEKRLRAENPEVLKKILGVTASSFEDDDVENCNEGVDDETEGEELSDPFETDFENVVARHRKLFEGLRGVFTFLVLFDHYHHKTDYLTPDGMMAEKYLCVYCLKSDVIFFFILSGFTTALQLRNPVKHEVVTVDGAPTIQIKPRGKLRVVNFLVTRFVGLFPVLWIGLILNGPIWYDQNVKAPAYNAKADPGIVSKDSPQAKACVFLYVVGMQSWWRPECHYVGPNTMVYASEVINIFVLYIIARYAFDALQNRIMTWKEDSLHLFSSNFSGHQDTRSRKSHQDLKTRTWAQFVGNEVTRFAYNRLDTFRAIMSTLVVVPISFGLWAVYYKGAAFENKNTQNAPQFVAYFVGGVAAASVLEVWSFVSWSRTARADQSSSCRQTVASIVYRCIPDTIGCMTLFMYILTDKWVEEGAANPLIGYDPNKFSSPGKGGLPNLLWWVILPMCLFLYLVFVMQERRKTFFKCFFELPCFTWIGYISYPTYLLQAVFFEYYAPSLYKSEQEGRRVWVHQYNGMVWFHALPVGAKVACTFILFIICAFIQYVIQDTLVIYLYSSASNFVSRCLKGKWPATLKVEAPKVGLVYPCTEPPPPIQTN